MSVHHLPSASKDYEARIRDLKLRHIVEVDQAYSAGVETALLYVCLAVALVLFWAFLTFVVVIPVWDWLT